MTGPTLAAGEPLAAPARRWSGTLADGREIIYFDEDVAAARETVDRRDLPPVLPASEVRFDPLLGEWVGIAGHRQTRTYHPPANQCPLCPSTADNSSEIPSPDYDVVVFENRFPSFAGTGPSPADAAPFQPFAGVGRCEVVCFTSDHHSTFSRLSPSRVRTVVDAWIDRTAELSELPGVELVFPFENRGVEIGVTLAHPHGQIYGYPFVPPNVAAMVRNVAEHRERTGRNLFADTLTGEEQDGRRIVAQNRSWVAFVPFAARWPVEVHLYPRRQHADLTTLDPAERDEFARLYLQILHRMEGVFDEDTMPLIAGWYQAPVHDRHRDDFWLHMEVFSIRRAVGRLKFLAGSESAMGAFINDITPEAAAQRLRDVALPAE